MSKKFLKNILFAAAALILLAAAGVFVWLRAGRIESSAALVSGQEIVILVRVPGVVEEVQAKAGDVLEAGAPLLTLDSSRQLAALETARADLIRLSADTRQEAAPPAYIPQGMSLEHARRLAAAQQTEETARALMERLSVSLAQARLERRRLELQNPRPAPEIIAAAIEREKTNNAALAAAEEQLAHASKARADLARPPYSDRGTDGDTMAELTALLTKRVREAEEALAGTRLTAPADAIVRLLEARPGESLPSGAVAARLEPLNMEQLWISALFTGADGTRIKPGMRCRVQIREEARPLEWRGVVEAIQAEENPAQAGATPEGSGRFSARIRLLPDQADPEHALRIGKKALVIVEARYPLVYDGPAKP